MTGDSIGSGKSVDVVMVSLRIVGTAGWRERDGRNGEHRKNEKNESRRKCSRIAALKAEGYTYPVQHDTKMNVLNELRQATYSQVFEINSQKYS